MRNLFYLKNSSDRIGLEFFIKTRIGFGLDNFGSDRILNISQLSDYKRPIRSQAAQSRKGQYRLNIV
jgi:hypothetical protein